MPISFDLETFAIYPGNLAPPIVCGSVAGEYGPGEILTRAEVRTRAKEILSNDLIVGANIAYDMGCLLADGCVTVEDVFRAYDEGRIYDVLIAEALHAIAGGHLFKDPRTSAPLKDPTTGKQSMRYSLAIVCDLNLGMADAKRNDAYRERYGELVDLPLSEWPPEAVQYPKDDARNTMDVYLAQRATHRNLPDLPAQCRAALALHLASVWGLRTDAARVEALAGKVEEEHLQFVRRFTGKYLREDGTEIQSAVKLAVAVAYGSDPSSKCPRCAGTGKIASAKSGQPVVCKASEGGCDGTGLELGSSVPRTEKGGIATDRDTKMESGDDDLAAYGEDTTEKIRDTYLPFLRQGVAGPINVRSNVLVESGRTSYDGLIQTLPKTGGVRECFVPRPGYVLCSIDYAAIELCTLAQSALWIVGKSAMAEEINRTGDPGRLHTVLAARMVGESADDLTRLVKAKDPTAVGYRQAAKAANFGFPGGMGASTLVLSKRKASEGTTTSRTGQVYNGIRFCLLIGGETVCGAEKVTEWKGKAITPTCKRCIECAEDLRSAWFAQWPEIKEYFDFVSQLVDTAGELTQFVSERVRGGVTFTSGANGFFQGLAADGAKRALWQVARECYGSKGPLAGTRPLFFTHDEIVSEIPIPVMHEAASSMAEIMVGAMREVVPDVTVAAEPALMWRWSKDAATVRDENGRLVPDPKTA